MWLPPTSYSSSHKTAPNWAPSMRLGIPRLLHSPTTLVTLLRPETCDKLLCSPYVLPQSVFVAYGMVFCWFFVPLVIFPGLKGHMYCARQVQVLFTLFYIYVFWAFGRVVGLSGAEKVVLWLFGHSSEKTQIFGFISPCDPP